MTDKSIKARKRTEKEHRSLEKRGRLIFFGGLAIVLVIAVAIGVPVYLAVDKDSPPGLVIKDLEVGTGAEARAGNAVSVDCTVWSDNGTQIAATGLGLPLVFTLGESEVMEGLDQGIVGMKVGGKRRLTIPPDLGYGEQAFKDLPANSTITCEVVLLAVR